MWERLLLIKRYWFLRLVWFRGSSKNEAKIADYLPSSATSWWYWWLEIMSVRFLFVSQTNWKLYLFVFWRQFFITHLSIKSKWCNAMWCYALFFVWHCVWIEKNARAYLSFECFQETIFFGYKGNFHVASRLLSGTLLLFMLFLIFPDFVISFTKQ